MAETMTEKQKTDAYPFKPGLHPKTARLIDALMKGKVGDILTDEQLTEICGLNTGVHGEAYSYLQTAIRHCEREGIVWRRIRGAAAIKCLDSTEKEAVIDAKIKHMRRETNRAIRIQEAINGDGVTNPQAYLAKSAVLGTMYLLTSSQTIKKLEARRIEAPMNLKGLLEGCKRITDRNQDKQDGNGKTEDEAK